MWRIYRYAILACACLACVASSTFRAAADELSAGSGTPAALRTSFDPASVLGSEAAASEPLELPDLSGFAVKCGAFVGLLLASCISIFLWSAGRRSPGRPASGSSSLQLTDSVAIAPGVHVKILRTGSYRIAVGYDRTGMKGMLLLQDGFRDVLDAAESNLFSEPEQRERTPADVAMDSRELGRLGSGDSGGATPRRRSRYNTLAKAPRDAGWDLNQLTT